MIAVAAEAGEGFHCVENELIGYVFEKTGTMYLMSHHTSGIVSPGSE